MPSKPPYSIPSRRPAFYDTMPAPDTEGRFYPYDSRGELPDYLIRNVESLDLGELSKHPEKLRTPFSTLAVSDHVVRAIDAKSLSSAEGRIEQILLTVPHLEVDDGAEQGQRHIRGLIELLGKDREYVVVCHHSQLEMIVGWFVELSIPLDNVRPVRSVFRYSIWSQDGYVVMSSKHHPGKPFLCEGVLFTRFQDMTIADDVTAQAGVSAIHSLLGFQGGNILTTSGHVLIGEDYVHVNRHRAGLESRKDVVEAFERLLGREAVFLGRIAENHTSVTMPPTQWEKGVSGWYQPIFHIDMHVTPTGIINTDGREIVMVGRPSKAFEILGVRAYGPLPHNDGLFEEVEKQLAQHFDVRQLPLLLQHADPGPGKGTGYYHLTWNNVVIENYVDGEGTRQRVVYMPTYAEGAEGERLAVREKLDAGARAIWEELGFRVEAVSGAEDLAYGHGSLHCITKVLRRGPG